MSNYVNFNPIEAAMNEARGLLTKAVQAAMQSGTLPQCEVPNFVVEIPADVKNGDLASNIAMAGARNFKTAPQKAAQAICDAMIDLSGTMFSRVEIAGPGFINLYYSDAWFSEVLKATCTLEENYGKTDFGSKKRVNVEFVSANPTGPMHLGNARGGALGDCLAEVLTWAGYNTTREFYINDAGNQIVKFGKSLAARYMQILKGEENVVFPEDGYQGDDIKELAQSFVELHGDKYVQSSEKVLENELINYALPMNIAALKDDLTKYRIEYDVWFSESTLHDGGAVNDVLERLKNAGATYEKDGAIWYKSAEYSKKYGANKNSRKGESGEVNTEDKDEVLVRANGIPTYFAADIAYHYNKFAVRDFKTCINVWGADHHGHVARIKGAMDALGLNGEELHIVLMQFVRLLQNGEPVRMSKRTGKAITLASLLDDVPLDSARFFFNMRESTSAVDFDLDLAVKQDSENPVYYVQYAHARICSILKNLKQEGIVGCAVEECDLSELQHENEKNLIRLIANLPYEITMSAKNFEPARITRYAVELATQYHKFYNSCRVKGSEQKLLNARLALCNATQIALNNTLAMLKVTAPESM